MLDFYFQLPTSAQRPPRRIVRGQARFLPGLTAAAAPPQLACTRVGWKPLLVSTNSLGAPCQRATGSRPAPLAPGLPDCLAHSCVLLDSALPNSGPRPGR